MIRSVPDFWKGRKVFVTGATGFLGYWLTRELRNRRANVVALVRHPIPESPFFKNSLDKEVTLVSGDVTDIGLLEQTLNELEIDTVFHLAAQALVGIAHRSPLSTLETNIRGTWNLLEACRRMRSVSRIVVASSDKAYGEQEVLPYREDFPLCGSAPYEVSKSCSEMIARTYFKTYGLPVCITRCGNLYGGGDLNFSRIVPGTIRSALANKPPIIRSDGRYIRDYFYVQDAAEAYLILAEKMDQPGIIGEAFNFSNQDPLSVLKLTQLILRLMGKRQLKPKILGQAHHEIRRQYLSAVKARRKLQWKPHFNLEEGLRATIDWYSENYGCNSAKADK